MRIIYKDELLNKYVCSNVQNLIVESETELTLEYFGQRSIGAPIELMSISVKLKTDNAYFLQHEAAKDGVLNLTPFQV
mgnify:CR=1 FL=1